MTTQHTTFDGSVPRLRVVSCCLMLRPMVCGVVCCCMLWDVASVGMHVLAATPRERGGS